MKQKAFFLALVFFLAFQLKAQVPVMNPIQGPSSVCSPPASPKSYTASASNSPTSYSWSTLPSASVVIGNPSGAVTSIGFPNTNLTYTVYCSATNASGTSAVVAYVVTVFETPTVTFSGANSFCQGSSTNLSASPTIISASSTLTYSWSPSTGLSSTTGPIVTAYPQNTTTYNVLLTLGSCTNIAFVTVTVNPLPPIIALATPSAICSGQSSTVSVSGGAFIYFLGTTPIITGSSIVSPTSTTNYLIIGLGANTCSNSAQLSIQVNHGPAISAISVNSVMCIGETNSITINGAGTSYSVNSNPSAANFTIAPSGPTNYSITSLGTNGCLGSTVYSQIVSPCLGIGTKSLNEDIGVYPNPNNGTFVLSGNTTSTFFIFNEVGQLIKTGSVLAGSDTVISGLSSGIYFLISDSMKKKIVVFAN